MPSLAQSGNMIKEVNASFSGHKDTVLNYKSKAKANTNVVACGCLIHDIVHEKDSFSYVIHEADDSANRPTRPSTVTIKVKKNKCNCMWHTHLALPSEIWTANLVASSRSSLGNPSNSVCIDLFFSYNAGSSG